MEFNEFLASGALDVFVRFFQTGDLAVEAHQLSDGVFFEILAVEEMLPAVDDLAKLRAPVADVVVGCHIMPQESCDAHQAIAQNGAPNVADMHRFRDIGRAKIDEDFFRISGDSHTKSRVCRQTGERFGKKGILQSKIDKTRAGNLRRGSESA